MFARQVGFLSATVPGQSLTRLKQWLDAGADLGLPDLGRGEYLHDMMSELGPFRQAGESIVPTDWDVIGPFGAAVGLDADDMQTLARMCRGFCTARAEGADPLGIPPVDREEVLRP